MISTSGNLLTSCGDLKSSQLNSILILYIGLLDLVGALVKLCCVSSKYLIFINLALLAWQCFVFGFISGFCPYKNEFLACSNLLLLCKKGPFHTRRFCSKYFPQPFETHAHWVWYFSFVARFFSTAHIEDLVAHSGSSFVVASLLLSTTPRGVQAPLSLHRAVRSTKNCHIIPVRY